MQHKLAQPQNKTYNRLKAQLNKKQAKKDKELITQSGQSPFFSQGTGYKALLALKNPQKPQGGEIVLFNATDTLPQCYNWTILDDGLAQVLDTFKAGACNLTAVDAGNLTRTGDDAFTGYIPVVFYKSGNVGVKSRAQTHSGYQTVMATTAHAAFTAAQLSCVDEVLHTGVEPFIQSTNDYAGCEKPFSTQSMLMLLGLFVGLPTVLFGLYALLGKYRCNDTSSTSTLDPATQEPEPRSSWCGFLRKQKQHDTPTVDTYVALEEELDSPVNPVKSHFEIDNGSGIGSLNQS